MRGIQVQPAVFTVGSRYEIRDPPIGQGGMGVVYKAYDTVTRRYVALKTVSGLGNSKALHLFEKEWRVLARLSHPNIVDILETGQFEDNGQRKPFFVMPLLPGMTLDRLININSHRLPVDRIVEIIAQACRGLQAAHDQGLVHGDVKPSNLFVLDDDSVKIIDFGVVHLAEVQTVTGMKGTLQYLAPELLAGKPPSPLSDTFALAVVCYEAFTACKPFARPTEAETAEAIRNYIPPLASDINTAVNQLMSRTLHKAMAKQPLHRFSGAREFGEVLKKALRSEPIECFDSARIQPRIERAKKAQGEGDYQFARDILSELEAEGHLDPQIPLLRIQLDQTIQQKTIRQLLENARTCMEEEEYPLALQRIQEILEIAPQQIDALHVKAEIEKRRSEKQIEQWYRLVHQHIGNQLYSQARQGLEEILRLRPSDVQAHALLVQVDQQEKESLNIRKEKEQLYESALYCYHQGEISTALDKLERVLALSRQSPGTENADKEAQYQGLYRQIRSEREESRNAYAEARRQLEESNFNGVLALCAEFLKKNPAAPLFQALKLEAEERERQELSAALADVGRRVEAEADLDRQISILKEAAQRYPKEAHFQDNLKLIRERRELVNSMVNKAKQYEQRSQFAEALGQWDILRNIYRKYPGLDVEVERLTRKRDEQAREEMKSRWVRQIDQQLEVGDYEKAQSALREAVNEFPGDRELTSLEKLIAQGIERRTEAGTHFEEGKKLCASGDYESGISRLRKAAELDRRNWTIRAALLNALLDHGRTLLSKDWQSAKPLIQEALQLEEANPVARGLVAQVQDQERQAEVDTCVWEARDRQAAGDLQGALSRVQALLKKYPNDMRLSQLQTTLLNALRAEPSGAGETRKAPPTPKRHRLSPPGTGEYEAEEVSSGAQPPGSAGALEVAIGPELPAPAAPSADQPTRLLGEKSLLLRPWRWVGTMFKRYTADMRLSQLQATLLNAMHFRPSRANQTPRTRPPTPNRIRLSPAGAVEVREEQGRTGAQPLPDARAPAAAIALEPLTPKPPSAGQPARVTGRRLPSLQPWQWVSIAVVALLIIAAPGAIYLVRNSRPAVAPQTVSVPVQLRANVEGVNFKLDGRSLDSGNISLATGRQYVIEASREGYQTEVREITPSRVVAGPIEFTLTALLPKLSIVSDLSKGQVSLREQQVVSLQSGQLGPEELAFGHTNLKVWDGQRLLLEVPLDIQPGKAAILSGPMLAKDCSVAVVSMLGNSARIYASPELQGNSGTLPPQAIPPDGLAVDVPAAGTEFNLSDGRSLSLQPGNAPSLMISLSTSREGGILQVQANVPQAQVKIDGKARKYPMTNGAKTVWLGTGKHQIQVVAPGYADSDVREVEILKGKAAKQVFALSALQAQLFLQGVEPGATVYVDGEERGTTSVTGSLKLDVAPGEHRVGLKKSDYEDSPIVTREFTGSETIDGKQLPLLQNGSLNFNVTPADATITLRLGNEPPKVVRPNETVVLRKGTYTWMVQADHFQTVSGTSVVAPGTSTTVSPKLQPVRPQDLTAADLFENPSYWSQRGSWWVFKPSDYGWLKLRGGSFRVIIEKQPGALWGKKKAEWTLDYHGEGDKIAYSADGHTLSRQVISEGSIASKPVKTQFKEQPDVYQFIIDISPTRITVRDNGNNPIDEVKRSDPSADLGKIGFRGEIAINIQRLR